MHLQGCITALITPFDGDGAVDADAMRALIERQIAGGVAGLVVAGSTGEASALSTDEYVALVETVVRVVGGRVPVLAGTGQSSTRATIEQTRRAQRAGADAALVVTPPYVRPPQSGLIAHYRQVAEEGGLPVVLYNVPGRTGVDLLPATVHALHEVEGIVGIKEAYAIDGRMQALLPLQSARFAVLSGDDPSADAAMAMGAAGLISVASNIAPRQMSGYLGIARDRGAAAAGDAFALLAELFDFLGAESNPIAIKALMAALAQIGPGLRLPLLPSLREPAAVLALAERINAAEH